jgi:hypothetical protein
MAMFNVGSGLLGRVFSGFRVRDFPNRLSLLSWRLNYSESSNACPSSGLLVCHVPLKEYVMFDLLDQIRCLCWLEVGINRGLFDVFEGKLCGHYIQQNLQAYHSQ